MTDVEEYAQKKKKKKKRYKSPATKATQAAPKPQRRVQPKCAIINVSNSQQNMQSHEPSKYATIALI